MSNSWNPYQYGVWKNNNHYFRDSLTILMEALKRNESTGF